MIQVNLNQKIEVDLTPYGEEILTKHYEKLAKKNDKIDARTAIASHHKFADKYDFALWEFMSIFGDTMYNGNNKVVAEDNEIILLIENPNFVSNVEEDKIRVQTKRQTIEFTVSSIRIEEFNEEDGDFITLSLTDGRNVDVMTTPNMLKTYI